MAKLSIKSEKTTPIVGIFLVKEQIHHHIVAFVDKKRAFVSHSSAKKSNEILCSIQKNE